MGSVPEMHKWSTLIRSDLKWCIHLSRNLFLYFNYSVSVTAGNQGVPEGIRSQVLRSTSVDSPWESYIQSHGFVCIRSAGQPQIGPHFIWNRDKWRWARFVIHTYIGFQRCTKIHINTDSLPVHPSAPPNLYPFFSRNCLHILSKVFRSTAKQPTWEVG